MKWQTMWSENPHDYQKQGGPSVVEHVGYMTRKRQIEEFFAAGEQALAVRMKRFEYEAEADVPDDDPGRVYGGLDLIDVQDAVRELRERKEQERLAHEAWENARREEAEARDVVTDVADEAAESPEGA